MYDHVWNNIDSWERHRETLAQGKANKLLQQPLVFFIWTEHKHGEEQL